MTVIMTIKTVIMIITLHYQVLNNRIQENKYLSVITQQFYRFKWEEIVYKIDDIYCVI